MKKFELKLEDFDTTTGFWGQEWLRDQFSHPYSCPLARASKREKVFNDVVEICVCLSLFYQSSNGKYYNFEKRMGPKRLQWYFRMLKWGIKKSITIKYN